MSGLNRSRSGVCAQSFVKSVEAQAKDIVSSVSRLQDPTRPPSNRPPPSRLSLIPLSPSLSPPLPHTLSPSPSPLRFLPPPVQSLFAHEPHDLPSLRTLTSGAAHRMRWDAACRH